MTRGPRRGARGRAQTVTQDPRLDRVTREIGRFPDLDERGLTYDKNGRLAVRGTGAIHGTDQGLALDSGPEFEQRDGQLRLKNQGLVRPARDETLGTVDGTLEAAPQAGAVYSQAEVNAIVDAANNNFAELQAEVNRILAALRGAGLVS